MVDKSSGTNGNSRRLRGPDGSCLDCVLPAQVEDLRVRINRMASNELQEVKARIDVMAKDRDKHALTMQELLQQFELLAVAFEQHLTRFSEQSAILSDTIGRIGIRRIGLEETSL